MTTVGGTPLTDSARRRWRPTFADWTFALVAVVVVVQRYQVLRTGGAPPTIDSGNWLAYADQIFGDGARSDSIVYPPVVPVLVKAATSAFGLSIGVSGIAALAAAAPAFGTYATLRMLGLRFGALPAAIMLLGASSVGEAAAWGGFPQLIGFGLLPVTLLLLHRMFTTGTPRTGLYAGLAVAALAATTHFVAALAATAGAVLAILTIRRTARPSTGAVALLILPSLWLIPTYAGLIRGFIDSPREAAFFNEVAPGSLVDQIEFLYRDAAWLWRGLLVVALVGLLAFFHRRSVLWKISVATLAGTGIMIFLTRESRFLYALTVFTALAISLWLKHFDDVAATMRLSSDRTRQRTALALLAVLLAAGGWQVASGLDFFESQYATYGVLTPDLVAGFDRVAASTSEDDTIAVTSLRDAPIGWWVEAITGRDTYYGSPLRWLLFQDEIRRAEVANDLFIPPFPDAARIRTAAEAGIDLIMIPTDWVFYDLETIEAFIVEYPNAIEYVTPGLVVIDPAQLGG